MMAEFIVDDLRKWATAIRRDSQFVPHGTSGEDAELLETAATEIERLRRENERLHRELENRAAR